MRSSFVSVARRVTYVASKRAASAPLQARVVVLTCERARPAATVACTNTIWKAVKSSTPTPPYAVDAPDGEHDLEDLEEHGAGVEGIVDFAAEHEDANKINMSHDAGTGSGAFAVDAPDGEHDLEDLEEHAAGVENMIDFASKREDVDEINASHEAGATAAFAVDAPDGEHDLEDVEEHGRAAGRIIDAAAVLEDPGEVKKHQELQRRARIEAEIHPPVF